MLHQTVKKFIESNRLLSKGARVIVALSGGADSVALTDLLVRLGYACIGAHVNFHLRGDESDRDAAFSQQLCRELGIPFYKVDLYAAEYAEQQGVSVEMAARTLRYEWFEKLRKEHDAEAIAVAHHRDDSVETLLLNLIRGTGIRGLTGIKPRNGYVVRPLLCCDREAVLEYLSQRGLTYVTDRTNLLNEYRRNKIRNEVLPMLEAIQPSVRESIARTMSHLEDTTRFYEQALEEAGSRVCLPVGKGEYLRLHLPALEAEKAPLSLLYELLSDYGFGRMDVATIWKDRYGGPGKTHYSHTYRLLVDRECLLITDLPSGDEVEYRLEEGQDHLAAPLAMRVEWITGETAFPVSASQTVANLDADKLLFPLLFRRMQKGDSFVPFGMNGRKLLSDYCIDQKMNLAEKESLWLLCSGNDIVWIVGERIDNRFRISHNSSRVLRLTMESL